MSNVFRLLFLLSAYQRIVLWSSKLILSLSLIILFVLLILFTCLTGVPIT